MSVIDKIKLNGTTYDVGKILDATPAQGSINAVSSGGVYNALDTLQAQIPQIDPTLTQPGQAADAKAVGDAAISNINLTNHFFSLVDYGYKVPFHTEEDTSPDAVWKNQIGIDRNMVYITLNKHNAIPNAVYILISGEISLAANTNGIDAWTEGVQLEGGHNYKVSIDLVEGDSILNGVSLSVPQIVAYKAGTHTNIASWETSQKGGVASFTISESGSYNFILYIPKNKFTFSNAKFLVTLKCDETAIETTVNALEEAVSENDSDIETIKRSIFDISYRATRIADGTNIDDLLVVGTYKVPTTASAATMGGNPPTKAFGYKIAVISTTQENKLIQVAFITGNSLASQYVTFRYKTGDTWSDWRVVATTADIEKRYIQNGFVTPYGKTIPSFAKDGTTIIFYCYRCLAFYQDLNGKLHAPIVTTEDTLSVPHNSFVVFNVSNVALEVKTYAELSSTAYDYIILFYNSNGNVVGPFDKYQEKTIAKESEIPQYYVDHIESKAEDINLKIAEIENGDAFVFITDIHYPSNEMHSPAIVEDVCRKTAITTVQLNGDYINRESSKKLALTRINEVCGKYVYPGIKTYITVGNHEYNNPNISDDPDLLAAELSENELRWAILNTIRSDVVADENSLSYYYSNEYRKFRYFVGQVGRATSLTKKSIKWIASKLKDVPSGYSVVIFFHTVLKVENGEPVLQPSASDLVGIIDAVKTRANYTIDNDTYDYTNVNFDIVAVFCGDYHLDMDYTTTAGVHIIATTTDSQQQWYFNTEDERLPRTVGTIAEQAFDVVVVDTDSKKIYLTRIGAGEDREYSY